MQTNYGANTLVQETFRSSSKSFECTLEIDSTGFRYNHSHKDESGELDKIQKCMRFNLQQIESNRYSSAVIRDLRSIYETDKKRAANLEAQTTANLGLASDAPSTLSTEVSKTAIIFVMVVHKYFPRTPKDKIKPHLKVKKNKLVVRHFHGAGTSVSSRSLKELDSLISRYTKCIEEIKEEFKKLKEEYPSLSPSEMPWDSNSKTLEAVTKKREKVIEKMPEELRNGYLASIKALPSTPSILQANSPKAPIGQSAIPSTLPRQQFLSSSRISSPTYGTLSPIAATQSGPPLNSIRQVTSPFPSLMTQLSQKRAAESQTNLEDKQQNNTEEPSTLSTEASKTAIIFVTVVHKHFPRTSKDKIKPRLKYKVKKNQLLVSHFHGVGTNFGARSISELDGLLTRFTACINELKIEFEKLKEQYPSLNPNEMPWDSHLKVIEVVTKKREEVLEKMPKEYRDGYLASIKALPSTPSILQTNSPKAPIGQGAIPSTLSRQQFLSPSRISSPTYGTLSPLALTQSGSPLPTSSPALMAQLFQKRAAERQTNLEDKQQNKPEESSTLSFEASKTANIFVTVVHKYFPRTPKGQIRPHLKYKVIKNQLVVRHFHGAGTSIGSRSIKELDSLISRYTKCIEEIKGEFKKLKDEYPSLTPNEMPWDSNSKTLEAVTKKRERVIEKMPRELRDGYLTSINANPSSPVISSPTDGSSSPLMPIQPGSPLNSVSRQILPNPLAYRTLPPIMPILPKLSLNSLARQEMRPPIALMAQVSHKRTLEEDNSLLLKPIILNENEEVENEGFQTTSIKKPRIEKQSAENKTSPQKLDISYLLNN